MRCDKLNILTAGVEYDLWSDSSRFRWISQNGFGSPGISRVTERGPFQHGLTNIDFRLNPRIIQLAITAIARNTQQHYDNRDYLLRMFNPSNTVSVLKYEMPDGTERYIDVLYNGGIDLDFNRMTEAKTKTYAVELIAPDPTWYDPTQVSVVYGTVTQDELVFPITFPIEFGSLALSTATDWTYDGTWLSYPTITIEGPVSNFTIENLGTDEKIQLLYNIANGETVIISLEYGNKTVVSDLAGNIIGTLSDDSDLATFHIATNTEVAGGINELQITGSDMQNGVTEITVTYYERYIGV